jgi:hypothetical protein
VEGVKAGEDAAGAFGCAGGRQRNINSERTCRSRWWQHRSRSGRSGARSQIGGSGRRGANIGNSCLFLFV